MGLVLVAMAVFKAAAHDFEQDGIFYMLDVFCIGGCPQSTLLKVAFQEIEEFL